MICMKFNTEGQVIAALAIIDSNKGYPKVHRVGKQATERWAFPAQSADGSFFWFKKPPYPEDIVDVPVPYTEEEFDVSWVNTVD